MKKIITKLGGLCLLQTTLFAGGIIAPQTLDKNNVNVQSELEEKNSYDFYVGLGRSTMSLENTLTQENFSSKGVLLLAGYTYNKYLSIEGRYTHHLGKVHYNHGNRHQTNGGVHIADYPTDFTNVAVYLKPTYAVKNIAFYALLGYGEVKLTNIPMGDVDRAEDGFQWGLGVTQKLTDTFALHFDYVNMYEDKGFDYRAQNADIKVDAWTLSISYKF